MLTLKFPTRSAAMPASGGMIMAITGVTAFITAVSSTLMPSSLMWMVRYGYRTKRAAENNMQINQLKGIQLLKTNQLFHLAQVNDLKSVLRYALLCEFNA